MLRMYSVNCFSISIHALREEGDCGRCGRCRWWSRISIHALREEGDILSHFAAGR